MFVNNTSIQFSVMYTFIRFILKSHYLDHDIVVHVLYERYRILERHQYHIGAMRGSSLGNSHSRENCTDSPMNIQMKFLLTSELCCPRNAALGQKDFTECFIFFENACTTEWKKAKRKECQRKRQRKAARAIGMNDSLNG